MNMNTNMNGYSYGSDPEYDSEYDEYLEELEYRRRVEENDKLKKEKEEKDRIENEKLEAEKLKRDLHIVTPFLNWTKTQNKVLTVEKLSFDDLDKGWTQVKKENKKEEKKEEKKIINTNTNKTEICKYALKKEKCAHKTCRYAHSIIELNVVECNYGPNCKAVRFNSYACRYSNDTKKDKVCMRIHPKETNENFYSRVNNFIPLTEEEMDLVYNCIEDFEKKNVELVHTFDKKASNLPSNKSIKYIIPTPFYDVHAVSYGELEPVEEEKKSVKKTSEKVVKKNWIANKVTKIEKPKENDNSKNLEKIKKFGVQIQDMREKIKKNINIFERFSARVDNVACQKQCEVIKIENDKLTSNIDNLLIQIEKIKNPPVKIEKKVIIKTVTEHKAEKKVEIICIKKFDTDSRSFKAALNVISSEPSQYYIESNIIKEVNEVKTKTEMCKSYGKYICSLGDKCRFAHNFDELNIISCPYGNKCYDIECSSGEYLNKNNMKNRVCNKKHPGETIENVRNRIGNKVINKVVVPEVTDKSKTVLCNSVLNNYNCKLGNNCKFAHNAKELKVIPCAYGDNCFDVEICSGVYINKNNTKRVCNRKHPSETTNNLYKRLGL